MVVQRASVVRRAVSWHSWHIFVISTFQAKIVPLCIWLFLDDSVVSDGVFQALRTLGQLYVPMKRSPSAMVTSSRNV